MNGVYPVIPVQLYPSKLPCTYLTGPPIQRRPSAATMNSARSTVTEVEAGAGSLSDDE